MKLTAKLLKNLIQEQVDELDPKAELMKRYKKLKSKSEKERLSPDENREFRHIARVLDPVDHSMFQEEDRDGDMPKRLSPKEIFGEFQNFVELNGISMEQLEAMALLQQFMKEYSVDAEEVSNMADMMKDEDPLNESPSMEHITPENIELVIRVLRNLGLLITPMAGAALGINRMLDKTKKPEVSEK